MAKSARYEKFVGAPFVGGGAFVLELREAKLRYATLLVSRIVPLFRHLHACYLVHHCQQEDHVSS